MAKRKFIFENDVFYHVYNRGVDKREIFMDKEDLKYFLDRIQDFNSNESLGGVYKQGYLKNQKRRSKASPLVEVIVFALVDNHFHLILKQKEIGGVSKFLHKIGTGYTKFFNKKYKRNGSLFQGKFKAVEIKTEGRMNYLSAYVNLNDKVHKINKNSKLIKTSWGEYTKNSNGICIINDVIGNFKSKQDYEKYAKSQLRDILEERYSDEDKDKFLDI